MREENREDIYRRERSDPTEGDRPWPLGIWILVLTMTSFGFAYLLLFSGDGSLGQGDLRDHAAPRFTGVPPGEAAAIAEEVEVDMDALGRQVYQSVCMACHQSTGLGLAGAFPPLAGSEWVLEDPAVPVRVVLHGLVGPITVKGVDYNGAMPGFGAQLSDEDVAAVVTYIRGSWGNDADPVTPEFVAELRASDGARGPWTGDEVRN